MTTELTTIDRNGQPITWPVTPYYSGGAPCIDVTTGLGYPKKANDASANPLVKWGRAADALNATVKAEVATYTAKDMCGAPATAEGWHAPLDLHTALISGLEPNTQYFVSGRGER